MTSDITSRLRALAPADRDAVGYAPGDLLDGRYRLISLLGEGGMASVWQAQSLALGIEVAVKLIRDERHSPAVMERMRTEARAMARLDHPSIARIFELGETSAREPFLVMEMLRGESLAVLLCGGPVTEAYAVQLVLPIASALSAAHAIGIVHRDIKPDNIILLPLDTGVGARLPKVIDFGIARFMGLSAVGRQTYAGERVGTPAYMAPEQVRGTLDLDERADVWSLSVVLYELIAGRVPFPELTLDSVCVAILEHEPLPSTVREGGNADLWRIVLRGIAKDRWERWQTMEALGEALAEWAAERGVTRDCTGAALSVHWLRTRKRAADYDVRAERVTILPSAPASRPP